MSEVFDQGQAASAQSGSAGTLIRRAREAEGVHIAALAVALKVPVRRLEALEADRYDLLPDAVFARALASSVCRSLKLNPEHILPLLPKGQAQTLSVEGHINEPFRSSQESSAAWPRLSRPALVAGGVLVLAALVVFFWPELKSLVPGSSAPAAVQSSPVPAPAAPAANGTVVETVPSASTLAVPPPGAPAEAAPSVPATR